jgi:hypothetical protein
MPEVENLHGGGIVMDSVVNHDWRMYDLADTRTATNRTADIGKALQNISVIEESFAKPFGCSCEIDPGVFDDLLKIG